MANICPDWPAPNGPPGTLGRCNSRRMTSVYTREESPSARITRNGQRREADAMVRSESCVNGHETRRPTGRPSHLTPETFSMPAALCATSLSRQWTRPLTGSHVAFCRACEPPVARSACARNRESVFDNEYGFRGWGGAGWWIWLSA
jgi:hypothetical protein